MKFNIKIYNLRALISFLLTFWLYLLMILAISTTAFTNAENTSSKSLSIELIEASKVTVKALEQVRQAVDMKTSSLELMAKKLNFDPQAAVEYVTKEIKFLPYVGSMRAEVGAMETGSASTLDQALLLGGLLDIMGVDVVLAHGQLESEDTNRLMAEALKIEAPKSALDETKLNQLNIPKSASKELQEQATPSAKDIESRLANISNILRKSLKTTTKDPLQEIITDTSKNYVWIRYRDVPTDPWVDVHPAFSIRMPPSPIIKSYSQIEIPKGRGHTFGFKLIIEITEKNKKRETTLAHFKPKLISELAAEQIDLTLVPSGMNPTKLSIGAKASYFFPVINGEIPANAKAFSTRGRIVPATAVTAQKSGAAVANVFGDLSSLLDSTNQKELITRPHVTGIWIEAIYKSPLSEQTRRRPLIDLTDSKPGDVVSATDAMLRMVIDFNIGQTNLARKMDYQSNAMIGKVKRLPYLNAIASGKMTMDDYNAENILIVADDKDVWTSMAMMNPLYLPARFEKSPVLPLTALVSTITTSTTLGKDEDTLLVRQVMDLMFTDSVILSGDEKKLKIDREATLRLGVYRTLVESLMLTSTMDENPLTINIGKLSEINTTKELALHIKNKKLDNRTAVRLTQDLKSAGTILPNDASQEGDLRWWKINQSTGEALGMGLTGGTTGTTYTVLTTINSKSAVSVGFFITGVWGCAGKVRADSGTVSSDANIRNNSTNPALSPDENIRNFQKCLAINTALYFAGGALTSAYVKGLQMDAIATFYTGLIVDLAAMAGGNKLNSAVTSGSN